MSKSHERRNDHLIAILRLNHSSLRARSRWARDVIAAKPDWVSIYIGINDVWRLFGDSTEEAVPVAEYESIYRDLLEETRGKTGAGLILMTPTLLEPDRDDPFRRGIDGHIEAVRRVAEEFQAIFVDLQRAFDAAMRAQPPAFWAEDRVHVGGPGHALIAQSWIECVQTAGR